MEIESVMQLFHNYGHGRAIGVLMCCLHDFMDGLLVHALEVAVTCSSTLSVMLDQTISVSYDILVYQDLADKSCVGVNCRITRRSELP